MRRTLPRAAAVLLSLAILTGCTTDDPYTGAVRSNDVIPAGMSEYRIDQPDILIKGTDVPAEREGEYVDALTAALEPLGTFRVGADTISDNYYLVVQAVDLSALQSFTQAQDAVNATLEQLAGKKVETTIDAIEREGIVFSVPISDSGQASSALDSRTRTLLNNVLQGGYATEVADGGRSLQVVYLGHGVTETGVNVVRRDLATAFDVPVEDVTAKPTR